MVSRVSSLSRHDLKGSEAGVAATTRVRVRTVALPVEHGGWGLSLEPPVLGILVAPSWPGLFLAAATLAAFLARHPLKIVAGDRRRGRRFPRTPVAERFAALYCAAAALAVVAAFAASGSVEFLLPLILAAPLACVQLIYDAKGRSRELLPEIAGSIAMASVAASVALAGGWPRQAALTLWALLAARVVPTIFYVRARLRLLHSRTASAAPTYYSHAAAVALASTLALAGLAPKLSVVAMLVLLLRATLGIADRKPGTAKMIGLCEIGFGALTVFAVTAGYLFGL